MTRDEDNLWGLLLTAIDISQDVVHYMMEANVESLTVMQNITPQKQFGLEVERHTCYIDNIDYIRIGNIIEWSRKVDEINEKERKAKEKELTRAEALRKQNLRRCRGF